MNLNLEQAQLLREAVRYGCIDSINLEGLQIDAEVCNGLVKAGLLSERRIGTASPTWRITYMGGNALGAGH